MFFGRMVWLLRYCRIRIDQVDTAIQQPISTSLSRIVPAFC